MNYSIRNIAALLDAAKRGDLNEAKRLIIEEADVNAYDGSQGNSLYWAVKNNHSYIAKVLLDNGADFIAYDSSRERHVLNKYEEVKAEHCKVSLHLAARLGDLKAVEDLLKKEANVNTKNDKGQTPLDLAKTEEIKTLLLKPPKKIDDSIASKDNEVGQEEDAEQEGNAQLSLQEQEEESQEISAEEESDVKIEAADNGHLPYAEPTQNRVSTNEEQPSSFFDNLLNIIMKPFSLIASFFGGFFSWLFGSDEPSTEYDQIIAPSNSGGEELTNYQEGDNNII